MPEPKAAWRLTLQFTRVDTCFGIIAKIKIGPLNIALFESLASNFVMLYDSEAWQIFCMRTRNM